MFFTKMVDKFKNSRLVVAFLKPERMVLRWFLFAIVWVTTNAVVVDLLSMLNWDGFWLMIFFCFSFLLYVLFAVLVELKIIDKVLEDGERERLENEDWLEKFSQGDENDH